MASLIDGHWLPVKDGDDRARALYLRHYSRKPNHNRLRARQFVGTGDYLALMTVQCDALFVWVRPPGGVQFYGQQGVNCSIFRNESATRSSDLIREAMDLAWSRWPGERLYTYVNPRKIRSTNPDACFKHAGWRRCGMSKGGLVILEALPEVSA